MRAQIDMFLYVASVLCLRISTGEKYYMVNSMHSFLNYIWISDRKSSAPFSSSPSTPSPTHPIPSHPLCRPCAPCWESSTFYGQTRGVVTFKQKWTLIIMTTHFYCMTPTQIEEAHKRESGKATGRCSRHLRKTSRQIKKSKCISRIN